MEIDQEKFNKLKQLDRIEYLSKKSILDNFMNAIFILGYLLSFFGLTLLYLGENSPTYITAGILGTFGGLFFIFLYYLSYRKSFKDLQEEYFSVEVKK